MSTITEGSHRTFNAGADLSTSRNLLVKLNSSGNVILAAAATDAVIGVLHNTPKSGEEADVRVLSGDATLKAIAGGTIAVGDVLTSDAAGKVIVATQAAAGAQPTTNSVGRAIKAAVAGDVVEFIPLQGKY